MINKIKELELGWYYNEKAIKVKNTKKEVKILKEAVLKNVETPYTYDRLSILLAKKGDQEESLEVCRKYEKIMKKRLEYRKRKGYPEDINSRERKIIKRLKKLREKNN